MDNINPIIYKVSFGFILSCLALYLKAQSDNLLTKKLSGIDLKNVLVSQADWKPFPKYEDRDAWESKTNRLIHIISLAEQQLQYKWPSLPVSSYLAYTGKGDRQAYESTCFEKRNVLHTLLLAELCEGRGRFLEQIASGVWSICEESFWGVPAHLDSHLANKKAYSVLPDVTFPVVDLVAAETASNLALVYYSLGYQLDSISPQLKKRIRHEINSRIFEPILNVNFWWMGFPGGRERPNNWNPWICSNVLNALLILEKDQGKREQMVKRVVSTLDNYLNHYPEDGGCDEGAVYWLAASACLFDNLEMLKEATHGRFDLFDVQKIKNMANFIYQVQISDRYFINFADCPPQIAIAPSASEIYRFGRAVNDPKMMQFASYYRKESSVPVNNWHAFRTFYDLFSNDVPAETEKKLPLPQNVWFPGIQVMATRDKKGTDKGFFVAAKGGTNGESHNHNDVGNYIVYYDGYPLIIDAGHGTYTAKTFSNRRYEIWSNRSDYHNVPTINGFLQNAGNNYRAGNVTYRKGKTYTQLKMDLSEAYPKEAGIVYWRRSIRLDRGEKVTVTEDVSLDTVGMSRVHLLTSYSPEVSRPGELCIHYVGLQEKPVDFAVRYNPDVFTPEIEKVVMDSPEDGGILSSWGDSIYRVSLIIKSPAKKAKYTYIISPK